MATLSSAARLRGGNLRLWLPEQEPNETSGSARSARNCRVTPEARFDAGRQPLLPRHPAPVFHVQHGPHDASLPTVRRVPSLERQRRHTAVLVGGHPAVTQAPHPFWHGRLGQPWWCRRRFVHGAQTDGFVPAQKRRRWSRDSPACFLAASRLQRGGVACRTS